MELTHQSAPHHRSSTELIAMRRRSFKRKMINKSYISDKIVYSTRVTLEDKRIRHVHGLPDFDVNIGEIVECWHFLSAVRALCRPQSSRVSRIDSHVGKWVLRLTCRECRNIKYNNWSLRYINRSRPERVFRYRQCASCSVETSERRSVGFRIRSFELGVASSKEYSIRPIWNIDNHERTLSKNQRDDNRTAIISDVL